MGSDPGRIARPCGGRIRRAAAAVVGLLGVTIVAAGPAPALPSGASGRGAIEIERDVAYPTGATTTSTLDAYLVAGTHSAPAVVLVHGGGWSGGDKSSMSGLASAFAQAGFSAFSVDYRLAPTAPYPAGVDDVAAAVRWLRDPAQVQRFGIDPSRMGLFGVSAGGTLAAWVAMSGHGALDDGARVRAVASWSGPMALVKYAVKAVPGSPGTAVGAYLGCEPRSCPSRVRDASPIAHVDGSDPPMLIANSRREIVPVEQARAMDDALTVAGVGHHLLLYAGKLHAEQLTAVALQPTLAFFRRELG